jgi:lambda family phage portal protein
MAVTQNWIDRAIAFASPERGIRRVAAREMLASYKGGVPTRTSEGFGGANTFRFQSNEERHQLMSARDRAIQAFNNNPVAKTLLKTETDNVIGDGLNFQPTSDDEAWNREAKDRYYQWLDVASVRGPDYLGGCELQRVLWMRSRIAGDIGWILVARGPESRIQVVPSQNIVTPDGQWGDRTIYDGVKFDEFGAPLTYYVLYQDQQGNFARRFEPVSARDFVFLPHSTDPAAARGESALTCVLELLNHLDRYVDGLSLAAWMATVFGLMFKEPTASKQFQGLGSLINSAGQTQRAITLENGQIKYMAPEGEIAQVDAKQPHQYSDNLIRALFRMIGQPFDMPLEVLAKDMSSVNFSSARVGLLPFYRACRIRAAHFGTRWSRTIRFWLSRERLRADDDPRRWKTPFPANYWNHELLVNAWPYTDPVSESQADLLQMDMGTKSPQQVIAERGYDAEQILRDRAEWGKRTAGLPPPEVRSSLTREAPAGSSDEDDKAFKRDVVKAYLTDPTVKNVIYNVSDFPDLLASAGLKPDADVDAAAGEGVPFLPVVGVAGPLVTGDTIQDPEGKLVGGDVELPEPITPAPAAPPAQP